jgi:hypothetical protein
VAFGSGGHPILHGIREHARANYAKAALRWRCNDYPYAALISMIEARARALQLKGVRAGDTIAVPAVRGIGTVVDVAALWSLGTAPLMLRASPCSPISVDAAVRARVAGILGPDGEYVPTHLVTRQRPAGPAFALILNPHNRPYSACLLTKTLPQLAELTQLAQEAFSVGDRTVLALSDPVDESFAFETWAVLANGGTVDMVDDCTARDAAVLVGHLNESAVDLVQLTPSTLQMLSVAWTDHAVAGGVRDVLLPDDAGAGSDLVARYFPSARMHHLRESPGSGRRGLW